MTDKMRAELEALRLMKDEDIDYSDAPEITDWSRMVQGKFYRPRKQQITLRLDMDVLEWFKQSAKQYQTLINLACRTYMMQHLKPKKKVVKKAKKAKRK